MLDILLAYPQPRVEPMTGTILTVSATRLRWSSPRLYSMKVAQPYLYTCLERNAIPTFIQHPHGS